MSLALIVATVAVVLLVGLLWLAHVYPMVTPVSEEDEREALYDLGLNPDDFPSYRKKR